MNHDSLSYLLLLSSTLNLSGATSNRWISILKYAAATANQCGIKTQNNS